MVPHKPDPGIASRLDEVLLFPSLPLGPQSLPLGLEFRIPSYEKLTKNVSERKGRQNRIEFLQLAN